MMVTVWGCEHSHFKNVCKANMANRYHVLLGVLLARGRSLEHLEKKVLSLYLRHLLGFGIIKIIILGFTKNSRKTLQTVYIPRICKGR